MAKKPRFKYDVFISYSHRNKIWVHGRLLPRLEKAGLKVFIDFRDFKIGAASIKEMERGITQSHKTLMVLTPEYLKSEWTEFEAIMTQTLSRANLDLRVIPVYKKKCKLPVRIAFMHYVNFEKPKDKEKEWEKLIDALGGQQIAQKILVVNDAFGGQQIAQKILVVDDTPDVRETIGGLIKDNGYEVYMAEDEDSAFKIFKHASIDFAVIDVRLHEAPDDESGLKLANAIYALAPQIQIVILSGSTKPRHIISAFKDFGVVDYIVKTAGWGDRLLKVIKEHPRKQSKK